MIPPHRVGFPLGMVVALSMIVKNVVWWRRTRAAGARDRLDVAVARVIFLAFGIIFLLLTLLFFILFELEYQSSPR
jgi:hypothetical protein